MNRVLFSSASEHWSTPEDVYADLDDEFHFNDDPCPLNPESDGLKREWGSRTFCNPPYNRMTMKWMVKGFIEHLQGKLVVFLVASRTDTKWWHRVVMKADEIRFIEGRLKFGGSKNSAPFPSAIIVFRGKS